MSSNTGPAEKAGRKALVRYMDLGMRFALSVFLGVYLGHWLDERWGTTPLFLLIGLFLGATSGFWTIYKAVFPPRTGDDNDAEDV